MRFHTTITCDAGGITVGVADEVTETIREQGYPGEGWQREGDQLKWEAEFEGETLDEINRRYNETRDSIDSIDGYGFFTWTANPDDPIEHAQRTAKDVLEWERHFDGIELPDELREALQKIAGYES